MVTKTKKRYFHRLTEDEYDSLCEIRMTWEECAKKYPQPRWCSYPNAVDILGCWSLMDFLITGRRYCKGCEFCIEKES